MKLALRSEVLSRKRYVTGHISSLVMMQPLKSFKLCCLKWSFCFILTSEGLCNFSAGMDYLIRLQRLDLEGWVVSFPVCQQLLCMAPNHFHFRIVRIVPSTTPGSVSLVHGFNLDKNVSYLFSTPQARSQQLTDILIHLLKKLAPVIGISGVLYLVDPMWIFSPRIW